MNHTTHNRSVSFIGNIAADVLRDVYVPGKYCDVILPMIVICRLDALLESSRENILKYKMLFEKPKLKWDL